MNKTPEYYKKFANEDGSVEYERELVCPYCYQEQKDLFDIEGAYEEGDSEYFCQFCGKEFEFNTNIEVGWSTHRKESEVK